MGTCRAICRPWSNFVLCGCVTHVHKHAHTHTQLIVHRIFFIYIYIKHDMIFLLLWRCDPTRVMASSFLMFLDHIQRRTTVGRTPLDEWSARRRGLYLTTYNTHNRQTSLPPMRFEPTISAGERPQIYCLRPRGHWDRRYMIYLLTAIGLRPGGSSTVHIYTQTIHGTTQWNRIPRKEHT